MTSPEVCPNRSGLTGHCLHETVAIQTVQAGPEARSVEMVCCWCPYQVWVEQVLVAPSGHGPHHPAKTWVARKQAELPDCPHAADFREPHRGPSKQHETDELAAGFTGPCR